MEMASLWPSAQYDIELGSHWIPDGTKPLFKPLLTNHQLGYLSESNFT